MTEHTALLPAPAPNEQQLPAPSGDDLDVMNRAVDIEIGQEIYGVAMAEIQDVRQNHLEEMPIGSKTRETFGKLMDRILTDEDGMMIFGGEYGEYNPLTNRVRLSPGVVDYQRGLIGNCTSAAKLDIDDKTLTKITIKYLTLHELGHTLQNAHRHVSNQAGQMEISDLSALAINHGVIARHPALPDRAGEDDYAKSIIEFHASKIDRERFAEGFAQMLIIEDISRQLSLDQETSAKLSTLLHGMRADQVEPVAEIIRVHGPGFININQAIRKGESVGLLQLGYGSPHTREDVVKEMSLTR